MIGFAGKLSPEIIETSFYIINGGILVLNLKIPKRIALAPTQVLVLGFAAVILTGAILLTLPVASASGESIGFINALFEATSAVCVTGLVAVDTRTDLTLFGQIVIICLIQVGGLGIMTFATLFFMIMGKRITFRERLVIQEALNEYSVSGVVRVTKKIIITVVAIEVLGALLLMYPMVSTYGPKGIYFAFFHAISAFCNAGFDLTGHYRSLCMFADNWLVNFTIMGLIVLGGLGFTVLIDIYTNRKWHI
jgi:trk system potassium uptake protein TrkH